MDGIKRKLIQIAAFGFTNFRLLNYKDGSIYTGKWKQFCTPGLNCYSCPAANFACPIGAIQAVAGSRKLSFSFYVVGFLLAVGVILGRAICGYLCPFGLFQELLYLIKTPKLKVWKPLKYVKYGVLVLFVLVLPAVVLDMAGLGKPWFCEYICPAGTLEAGIPLVIANSELQNAIGYLYFWKLGILIITIVASVFIFRFFCKTLCPLGAIYGILNKVSLLHLECDKTKCTECGRCKAVCQMEVNPSSDYRSAECIMCGRCTKHCSSGALSIKLTNKGD